MSMTTARTSSHRRYRKSSVWRRCWCSDSRSARSASKPIQGSASRGLSLADLGSAIGAADSNAPVGSLYGESRNLTLNSPSQLMKADEYRPLVVAWRSGRPVRLGDVATIREGVENEKTASWLNDRRSIILAIFRQPDANTVDVVDQIRGELPSYRRQLPAAVSLDVTNDRSISIRNAVRDVEFTLMLTGILVVLVIFAFLKLARATFIPALALPVSLVATFAVMAMLGYSIDNMSLLAITLSTGFVVDDAIVMLENIVRHVEGGMKPFAAAIAGAPQIGLNKQ
jgi:HAE1 family hydrophobic/amphiphilic exporter-1